MSQKTKKKKSDSFSKLEGFIRDLASGITPVVRGFPALKNMGRRLGDKWLSGNEALALEEILDDFCPSEISKNGNSRAVVDGWIQDCVLKVLDKKSGVEDSIKALKEKLKAQAAKWEVWQFVEGLKIPSEGFVFGRAVFHYLEGDYAKNRPEEFVKHDKTVGIFGFWGQKKPPPNSLLCRIYVDAADSTAAVRIAESELNTTLAVLNFFAPSLSNKTGATVISVAGKLPIYKAINESANAITIAFKEFPKSDFYSSSKFYGHVPCFDIRLLERTPKIQKIFNKTSSFLKGDGEKGFRERILTAMKLVGKGEAAENNEDAFLFFAVALESLILGGKDKNELRYRFSLRVAHLLGSTKEERCKIRDYAKKDLYDVRCSLVHTGKASIPDSDLDWLRRITFQCIFKLLGDDKFEKILTDIDLEKWFEDALMSGEEMHSKS